MPNFFIVIGLTLASTILSAFTVLHIPLHLIETKQAPTFGSTITTINGTDTLTSSRSVINTNFSNLNTDLVSVVASDALKFSLASWYATTSAPQLTGFGTITTGTWNAGIISPIYGGTGWAALQANTVLLGNGTTKIATTTSGTNGQVLGLSGGTIGWISTSTAAAGLSTLLATTTASMANFGIGASTTLAKFTVPANQIGTNGGVRVEVSVADAALNNTNDILEFEFAYGNATSTTVLTNTTALAMQCQGKIVFTLIANGTTGAQNLDTNVILVTSAVSGTYRGIVGETNTAIATDSTVSQTLMIVGQVVGGGNTFKPRAVVGTYLK